MKTQNYIFILYGPTGVGKTDLADALALQVPSEIVNIDMGQFYTPLTIGTAKPDWQNAPIRHHLFDIVSEPDNFTVVAYREKIEEVISKIWKQGKLPILVGGSAFYIRSLFFPPVTSHGTVVKKTYTGNVWDQLNAVDPIRASQIDKADTYRVERALDIWESTGRKPSELVPIYKPLCDYYLVCLTRDRQELCARIKDRVGVMMAAGWVEEVEQLMGTPWEDFIRKKKIIGYDEIVRYYAHRDSYTYEDLVGDISKRTCAYAKRQMTFWRMLKKQLEHELAQEDQPNVRSRIQELNLTGADIHRYINQLIYEIKIILSEGR